MNELPSHSLLDISTFSTVFSNVTNSYKYYWFLAILEHAKESDNPVIRLDDITLRMVADVWFPLNQYKLSFGQADSFIQISNIVSEKMKVDNSANSLALFDQIKNGFSSSDLIDLNLKLNSLLRYVPYRFIRPFFDKECRGLIDVNVNKKIQTLSNEFFNSEPHKVIYKIQNEYIKLNNNWFDYFKSNYVILKSFTYWHLLKFLQNQNPNVIGLSEKLFKPIKRDLLLGREYWKLILEINQEFKCIYSNQIIEPSDFDIDHFVPWSYVVHDQIWNLIPTNRSVNSSKSDNLPSMELYLDKFILAQFQSIEYIRQNEINKKEKFLVDFVKLFGSGVNTINEEVFSIKMKECILPMIQIASNLGFRSNWKY